MQHIHDKTTHHVVTNSDIVKDAFSGVITSLHHLFLKSLPASQNSDIDDLYINTLERHHDPQTHLQVFIDIIKCTFEHIPVSTILNGNPDFIIDSIPDSPFTIDTYSITSNEGEAPLQTVNRMLSETLPVTLKSQELYAILTVVCCHPKAFSLDLVAEISTIIPALPTTEEFWARTKQMLSENSRSDNESGCGHIHTGFCFEESLSGRQRVSVLAIRLAEPNKRTLQLV